MGFNMCKLVILALAASSFLVTGCATVAGVGQDVQSLGRGVSHFANEVREEFTGRDKHAARTSTRAPTSYPTPRVTVRDPYSAPRTNSSSYEPTRYVERLDCDPYANELAGGAVGPCSQ